MKRTVSLLLYFLLTALTLAGCGDSPALTPLMQQSTVIEVATVKNEGQALAEGQTVTDPTLLSVTGEFINEVSGLPPFSDISSIDKPWIVRKYFTQCASDFDKNLYDKYRFDMFTPLKDIEKLAKHKINPHITMNPTDDYSACDGSSRFNPLWIQEEGLFGWYGSGGLSGIYRALPLETLSYNGKYRIRAVDLYLAFDQEYFVDTNPTGGIYALPLDSADSNQYIQIGTFTLDEKSDIYTYDLTGDVNACVQYWYELEPGNDNGFKLTAKQAANDSSTGTIAVSMDGRNLSFGVPPVIRDGKLLFPFYQFCLEYGIDPNEVKTDLITLNGNDYCDVESLLFTLGGRMIIDEKSGVYHIYTKARIDKNAEAVGSYLLDLVNQKKAVILYQPKISTNGSEKTYKVVSILGDGYLEIQNGKPVIKNALEIPNSFGHLSVSEAAAKNYNTSKYIFGYFLDEKNYIVTDPVVLSQLQTLTLANWEYEVFRQGLTLMDSYLLFWEQPKHFTGMALLDKWNDCIKTAYDAVQFNQTAEPVLGFLESAAATVLSETLSPHSGVVNLLDKALKGIIQSTVIGMAVDAGIDTLQGQVKPVELVYGLTMTEHDIFLSQQKRMKEIVGKTGVGYLLTYDDACAFLQGYYQLNATMKTLYTSCQVYEELIPESRKSIQGALINLGQNVIIDKVLDATLVSELNKTIDSERVTSMIKDIASGVIDKATDSAEEPVYAFLSDMYKDIRNEKMKLNYALYNTISDSLSYAIVAH